MTARLLGPSSGGGLGRWVNFTKGLDAVSGNQGDLKVGKRSGLVKMTLREFIFSWKDELVEYYGSEFMTHKDDILYDTSIGDTVIFCLVDNDENVDHLPEEVKKKIRKSGKWRRDKLKHQWSYVNPLNRIHGYIVLKDVTNEQHKQKTLSISTVCSTYFSKKKGIGSDLMDLAKSFAEATGYFDIVLEVANEFSGMGKESDEEESADEDGSDDEESDDEESDEEEREYTHEGYTFTWVYETGELIDPETDEVVGHMVEDEDGEWSPVLNDGYEICMDDSWYPCENCIELLSEELWKKCMRKNHRDIPYYNLEQEYILDCLEDYFSCNLNSEDEDKLWEGTNVRSIFEDEPDDTEYYGFWYRKGKNSQKDLIKFYEKHGFVEDPDIHFTWCCFDSIPYPTMKFSFS